MLSASFHSIIPTFENALVRDLYWVMFSPPLLNENQWKDALVPYTLLAEWEEQSRDWFYELDKNPFPLKAWIAQLKTKRLGYLFEHFVHFFLKEVSFITLEYHNLQFPPNGITEGEIDFIFSFKQKRYHWEVAVKYYCQTHPENQFSQWIGPSANDRLDVKWNHLLHHQLPLSKRFLDIKIDFSHAFLKGKWYLPKKEEFPLSFQPDALRGEIFRMESFLQQFDKEQTFTILMRPFWLSDTVIPSERIPTVFRNDVRTYFKENPQKLQSVHIGWIQENTYQTAFIVADSWPEETDFSHKRFRKIE